MFDCDQVTIASHFQASTCNHVAVGVINFTSIKGAKNRNYRVFQKSPYRKVSIVLQKLFKMCARVLAPSPTPALTQKHV
jgi:hypothetical protein